MLNKAKPLASSSSCEDEILRAQLRMTLRHSLYEQKGWLFDATQLSWVICCRERREGVMDAWAASLSGFDQCALGAKGVAYFFYSLRQHLIVIEGKAAQYFTRREGCGGKET